MQYAYINSFVIGDKENDLKQLVSAQQTSKLKYSVFITISEGFPTIGRNTLVDWIKPIIRWLPLVQLHTSSHIAINHTIPVIIRTDRNYLRQFMITYTSYAKLIYHHAENRTKHIIFSTTVSRVKPLKYSIDVISLKLNFN